MLDDDAIARYARQIVVPGIGASGQQKLLAATVFVSGDTRGVAQARLYLEAAGLRVTADDPASADVAIVAGAGSVPPSLLSSLASGRIPVCWYALAEDGFTAGVHPGAALPVPAPAPPRDAESARLHDAAACEAASAACAIVLGLPLRGGTFRFQC